ncbi:hypothetical protein KEM55_000665 [Ascosphaera atra]|nr:hypothetical protein KEM55_000665 [Ascosphaera atra]
MSPPAVSQLLTNSPAQSMSSSPAPPPLVSVPASAPTVSVLIVGDPNCGKSTFLSYVSVLHGRCNAREREKTLADDQRPCPDSQADISGTHRRRLSLGQELAQTETQTQTLTQTQTHPHPHPQPQRQGEDKDKAKDAARPDLPVLRDEDQPYIYTVRLPRRRFQLAFYDTAYRATHWSQLRPDVVILAFDVMGRREGAMERLKEWRGEITRCFQAQEQDREDMQIMLLGLKRDLRTEAQDDRCITPHEAYKIAQDLRCDAYAECSALTGELVPQVFEDVARLAVLSKTGKAREQGGCCIL